MDWWFKRKLNEKASDRQGDGATARWFRAAFKQRFFPPLRRQQDDNYIMCCVKLDNDNS